MSASLWCAVSGLFLLVIALVFTVIGFATPYWASQGSDDYYAGLWQFCTDIPGNNDCGDLIDADNNEDWFVACQVLSVLGFVFIVIGVLLTLVWLCTYRLSIILKCCIIVVIILAFVFLATTVCLYRAEAIDFYRDVGLDMGLDWSFWLTVVGCVLTAISVIPIIPAEPSARGQSIYPNGYFGGCCYGYYGGYGGGGGFYGGDPYRLGRF